MRRLQPKRTPLATSGRFRRPNRPETPQHADVSPGQRSRRRTTPAENRTEVQDHGEIGAHFLRNPPEVAGGGATAGKAAAAASADAGATRGIAVNTPLSPAHPYREQKNGLTAPPPWAAARDSHSARRLARPAEKRPGPLAEAGHPFAQAGLRNLVERVPLFDGHTDARQRSMRPAHKSRLAASPLADIAKPPDRKRLRQASDNGSNMLRHAIFYAHVMPELEGTRSCLDLN